MGDCVKLKRAIPVIGNRPFYCGFRANQFITAVKLKAIITSKAQTVVIKENFRLLSIKPPYGSNCGVRIATLNVCQRIFS
ncbi:hypothetical protein M2403_000343 [Rahnella sp. BIGb0603]|jgi:hypothetical protein|nr:hypothetical protein [Rahnella sp. BIGb0603]